MFIFNLRALIYFNKIVYYKDVLILPTFVDQGIADNG